MFLLNFDFKQRTEILNNILHYRIIIHIILKINKS